MFINEFLETSEDIKKLLSIYKNEFTENYKKLKKNQIKKKKAIIKNSQLIFIKWYFTTLIDNTYFSPANILNRLVYEKYGGEVVAVPNVTPIFIENELRDFKISFRIFDYVNFDLLDDIEKVQSIIKLHQVKLEDYSLENVFDVYKNQVSIKEENYYYFLLQFALHLQTIQVIEQDDSKIIVAGDKEINKWHKIKYYEPLIDCVIYNAEHSIGNVLGDPNPLKEENLRKLLKNKIIFEDISKTILKGLGVKPKDFEKIFMNEISKENSYIANKLYLSERFFTKYFILPLSYYLPILQPCYILGNSLNDLFEIAFDEEKNDEPIEDIIFTDMMIYDLTRLGDKILESPRRVKYQDVFDKKVDVDEIIMMKNEINSNPMFSEFWKNIDIKEIEEFLNSLEEIEKVEEKPKKKFLKEGNIIHLFKKE